MPAASQSDTAEIQPARTVSEDSDSEGATLFQPVNFREHVQVWQVMQPSTATPACMAFFGLIISQRIIIKRFPAHDELRAGQVLPNSLSCPCKAYQCDTFDNHVMHFIKLDLGRPCRQGPLTLPNKAIYL